jgi:hypothetical protein
MQWLDNREKSTSSANISWAMSSEVNCDQQGRVKNRNDTFLSPDNDNDANAVGGTNDLILLSHKEPLRT